MGGSLSNWDVIPRLPKITAPTLVYNGEYDTSHDIAQVPFFELIPQVRWITISGGGHMCHLEGEGRRERVLHVHLASALRLPVLIPDLDTHVLLDLVF